jgi:hypothetical protein
MPIRRELRSLYPPHWKELSRRVRFDRARGRCEACGRPHATLIRCLPDGRWFDPAQQTWRDRCGRHAHWPDLLAMIPARTTLVLLAAAHLDHDPSNNRLRNLKSLCQRCHLLHDRPYHRAQRGLRPLKDTRTRRLNSLFGTVAVPAPRFKSCRCAVSARSILCPASELMPDCCTPEYERALAKMGAWLPYRCARRFLSEFFPLGDDLPWHETIRRRTACVGVGIERAAVSRAKSPRRAPPSETLTVSIDAGHVRAARGHQGRTFEVMAAQVSSDDGKPVLFSGVPSEADQQHTQLNGVLSSLGMTSDTAVTILSDGADGPRSLGEAASTGPEDGQSRSLAPRFSAPKSASCPVPYHCLDYAHSLRSAALAA